VHPNSVYGSVQEEHEGAYGTDAGAPAGGKAHDASYDGGDESAMESGMRHSDGGNGLRHSASGVGGGGGGHAANPHWQNTFDQLKVGTKLIEAYGLCVLSALCARLIRPGVLSAHMALRGTRRFG
jgi:hypothetical protein